MKKRVYIIHGWGGSPKSNWIPWLKSELEKKGFEVITPAMPNSDKPTIEEWVGYLKDIIKSPNRNTILVGHSIGCQAIMRYVESLSDKVKIGGMVLVAGFFTLKAFSARDEEAIADPWNETPMDTDKIKSKTAKITTIFSTNDPFVYVTDSKIFEEKLGAKIMIEKELGHFDESKYEVILSEVLKI